MSSPTEASHRGYTSHYTIQYTGSQRDRFGVEQRQKIWAMLSGRNIEIYPEGFTGQWDNFPRVARFRANLTALSQHYNLYFVAYMGWIHVYIPNRSAKGILDRPVALLGPEKSESRTAAYAYGQYIRACSQEVNHLVVGDLGDKEVVLVARDNGDVVAWYTHEIAQQVEQRLELVRHPPSGIQSIDDLRLASPSHFFTDNIGGSAWSLAIHKKSRLIAVSSDAHEVTVFAFAFQRNDPDAQFENQTVDRPGEPLSPRKIVADSFWQEPIEAEPESVQSLEQRFRTRRRAWRIVIPMGIEATEFSSLAFCEDEAGNADRVAALDITGYLFIAEIWGIGRRHVRIQPHNVQFPSGHQYHHPNGGIILPITDAQLLPTNTLREAIGLDPQHCVRRGNHPSRGVWIDSSRCIRELDDDAASDDHITRLEGFYKKDLSTVSDGLRSGLGYSLATPPTYIEMSAKVHKPVFDEDEGESHQAESPDDENAGRADESENRLLTATMVPPTGDHFVEFQSPKEQIDFSSSAAAMRKLNLPYALTLDGFRASYPKANLLRGVSFLRANAEDVEILTLREAKEDIGVVCHHVLPKVNLHNAQDTFDMALGWRCTMLLTIPELSLVILGSRCGRVALLTLTKPPRKRNMDGNDMDATPEE